MDWTLDVPDDPMELLDEVGDNHSAAMIIDPRDYTLRVDVAYTGSGIPIDIYYDVVLRVWLPEDVDVVALREYLTSEPGRTLLTVIAAGHEVAWDGHNWIGTLSETAAAALETLTEAVQVFHLAGRYEHAGRWEAADWLSLATSIKNHAVHVSDFPDDPVITPETTDAQLQAFANQLDETARNEYVSLRGTLAYLAGWRDRVRQVVEEEYAQHEGDAAASGTVIAY